MEYHDVHNVGCPGKTKEVEDLLQHDKGSMRDVLQLEDLPDITPDSDDLNHMRVQELVSWRH